MSGAAEKVIDEALRLSEQDRAFVAEQLLLSLARPDSAIEQIWAEEAEVRLDAYSRGELRAASLQEVFSK